MPLSRTKKLHIIGYSFRLPAVNNARDLHDNLINKINMVTKDNQRWQAGSHRTPEYFGKIKQSLDYFDNEFFSIHGKQAEKLDPQLRLLLETSFEALTDAAVFLDEIKGSSTGVYIGSCFSDAHRLWLRDKDVMTGYEHTGGANTMYANRLSYFYDIHGPSLNFDAACASSLIAMHYAIKDLQQGRCQLAMVGGSSILLDSAVTVGFNNLHMLAPDGFCKTFDKSANGYTRSEGVVVLVLTTEEQFIRYNPYATVLSSHINSCGYSEQGIAFPNGRLQAQLYQHITEASHVDKQDVTYIECHGTGTIAGDTEEINGIKTFFGDRDDLILGALKSNLGHTEATSGLASVVKTILSYETGYLYPQLHLNDRTECLGQLKTLHEAEQWQGGKAIVNSFGFGGANAAVLLENHANTQTKPTTTWHGLHFITSRTKEGLYQLKRELESAPQQLPLFIDHRYPWREVIGIPDAVQLDEVIERPIYFAFSGNGSQWAGMGLELLNASAQFKNTLLQCGQDIPTLLISGWSGPLAETRLLTAIQIGLIELIKSFGIKADGYIAHSAGEIAASYASGATTLAETMAIAEARGKSAEQMPNGLMISVGLNKEKVLPYLESANQVSIACINSPRNVTLSGNQQQIIKIMQQLIKEDIFVRELNTLKRPYHSSLIDDTPIKTYMQQAYQRKIKRNPLWLSTIANYEPEYFTTDYHVQSVLRPVDFLSAVKKIPAHAIIVEIGPHSILRSLIRDSLPDAKYVPTMTKETNDIDTFKESIGHLWKLGTKLSIKPDFIRPPLAVRATQTAWKRQYYPAPRDDYHENKYQKQFTFDLNGKDAYLLDHIIDGKPIFPAAGFVYIFWQCYLAAHPNCNLVTLDEFKIVRSVPLTGDSIKLIVIVNKSQHYEMLFNDELVAEAKLDHKEHASPVMQPPLSSEQDIIPAETLYRIFRNDGYDYGASFQGVQHVFIPDNPRYIVAKLQDKEWISFLDSLLQISLLHKTTAGLCLPTSIRHIELSEIKSESACYNHTINRLQCGDILIEGIEVTSAIRKKSCEHIVFLKEDYLLFGRDNAAQEMQFIEKCLSVVRQNANPKINIVEVGAKSDYLINQISPFLHPQDEITCIAITDEINKGDVVIATHKEADNDYLQRLDSAIKSGAFVLLFATLPARDIEALCQKTGLTLISYFNATTTIFFIRKSLTADYQVIAAPSVKFDESWAKNINHSAGPFLCYSNEPGGNAGFVRALNRENKRAISLCAPNAEPLLNDVKAAGLVTNLVIDNRLATLCYTKQPCDMMAANIDAYHLEFNSIGNLDAFQFIKNKPRPGLTCKVAFAALNFRDVMYASGKISRETFLGYSKKSLSGVGMEFSGFANNKRIMGIALDSIANVVATEFYWDIPDTIDMAGAATIPIAYLTVYYSFFERCRLDANHKVLIHGGTGAVGQAAIRVALDQGCEVFTTCQSSKRDYLKKLFPNINDEHIGDSRSTQFEQQVMEMTEGKGVNIVLNSLADDKLQASLRCLSQHGTFIEIGKYDLMRNTPIGMKHLLSNITICGVDLDQVFEDVAVMTRLSKLLAEGLQRGAVKPLDHQFFSCMQIPEAFRLLGAGKHVGKVLIDMQITTPPVVVDRFYTSGTHLIVGGLGGFGLVLAEWLASRGAEHLILVSRKGVTTGEQKWFLQRLKHQHPHLIIDIETHDLTQYDQAKKLIANHPTLTGIYNLALVLNDTFFESMTKEKWEETIRCKMSITEHLDQLTRHLEIKQFVCFSSLAVQGNPGQSNYAFANNFMESICYARRKTNLAGLAIQWGMIGNVGILSRQTKSLVDFISQQLGTELQSIESCLKYLEYCLSSNNPVNVVYRATEIKQPTAIKDSICLLDKIGKILNSNLHNMSQTSTLVALGMDSLQSAEIQSMISHATGDIIPLAQLAKITLTELNELNKKISTNQHESKRRAVKSSAQTQGHPAQNDTDKAQHRHCEERFLRQSNPDFDTSSQRPDCFVAKSAPRNDGVNNCQQPLVVKSNMINPPEAKANFSNYHNYLELKSLLHHYDQQGINLDYLTVTNGVSGACIEIHGKEYINFTGYNYLGLSGSSDISSAAIAAINTFGTSVSASRFVSGQKPIHATLEKEIANLIGAEDCLVYVSGYATNIAVITHLLGPNDLIVYDALCHNSLVQGIKFSGATHLMFQHNDYDELEQMLFKHRHQYDRALVITEGVYSMDGDIPDIHKIIHIKKQHDAFLMIDEAHSIGVLGNSGGGVREHFNLQPNDVDIWMGTLSKSFASCGGYIAGKHELIENLKYLSNGFVYSVGITPANAAAALASIQQLKAEPWRVSVLHQRANLLLSMLKNAGINTGQSGETPIIPIIIGNEQKTLEMSAALKNKHIFAMPILYPAVEKGKARIRLFINCLHTEKQINYTAETIIRLHAMIQPQNSQLDLAKEIS